MQITKIENKISSEYYTQPKFKKTASKKEEEKVLATKNSYYPINFQAKVKIINKKSLNFETEKNRILKHLEEFLIDKNPKNKIKDVTFKTILNSIIGMENKPEKLFAIIDLAHSTSHDINLPSETKIRRLKCLRKITTQLKNKQTITPLKTTPDEVNKQDEKIDYELVNRLKNAVSEDDYRLKRIYNKHYQNLKNINTLEELRKKYPSIKIPSTPEEVIAHKLIELIPRKVFLEYAELLEDNTDLKEEYFNNKISQLIEAVSKKYKLNPEFLKSKIYSQLQQEFNDKLERNEYNKFSNIPENKNINSIYLNDADIKLLNIDFERFVLLTIKKHYLELEKLNQIKYKEPTNGIEILVGSLSNTDYKFEKFPDKIRHIINAGEAILRTQRNYKLFDLEYLKTKLSFYAETNIGNNITLLEKIVDFDNSKDEDKQYLIRFLEELDQIYDEKQTSEEALEKIKFEDIRPRTMHKLNKIEQQKEIRKHKKEQEIRFKLDSVKENFDNAINLLYTNGLTESANICSTYRPKQFSPGQIKRANYLVNLINHYIHNEGGGEINQLEHSIKCWDKYYRQLNTDAEDIMFKKAKSFGSQDDKLNIIKAGQYLLNAEIVKNYPDSLDLVEFPELLTKIMEKTDNKSDEAIKYLCKLNDYEMLSSLDQTFMTKFIHLFDLKDNIDKIILKHIVENSYIYQDSTLTVIENGGELSNQKATISTAAKQSILEEKNFPNYIDLFINFENALPNFARAKGESGIKLIGRNDKTAEHKVELKTSKYPDRLFSSKNDLYFDIYSDKGLH